RRPDRRPSMRRDRPSRDRTERVSEGQGSRWSGGRERDYGPRFGNERRTERRDWSPRDEREADRPGGRPQRRSELRDDRRRPGREVRDGDFSSRGRQSDAGERRDRYDRGERREVRRDDRGGERRDDRG